ncbi:MAG TPA: hypothetical protein VG692_07010 [Gemmatimonadales bacterium]|nr:hypothetical protein [Gemmatimonadales bacterium]
MSDLVATLTRDGHPLAADVPVELTIEPHDPEGTRWHGVLRVPPATPLALGQQCHLQFPDGRRGDMEVTRLAYGRRSELVRVFFRGRSRLA